jgi:IstB-like ATP binding protein
VDGASRRSTEWVARLSDAKRHGNLETELRRLSFIPLIVVDEVGYIPFDPEAANLMFSLVSSRYERASMIVTSNKPFSAWGEPQGRQLPAPRQRPRRSPNTHHGLTLLLQELDPTPSAATAAAGILLRSPTARSAKNRPQSRHHVAYFSTGATGLVFARP